MIQLFLPVFIAAESISTSSPAQPASSVTTKDYGVGLTLGTPTGLTGKLYLDSRSRVLSRGGYAAQVSFGGHLGTLGDMVTSADVVYQTKPLNETEDGYRLPAYYGVGVSGGVNYSEGMIRGGLRAIAGLVVAIDDLPFELAIESGAALLWVVQVPVV